MTLLRRPISLIESPWESSFLELVSVAERDLLPVSPFVKIQPVDQILSDLRRRGVDKDIRVAMLTNLRPESILNGSTDVEAFHMLSKRLPRFELVHLPSLHAKVYVADDRVAVVTSANLTQPGITGNLEYGVAFTDSSAVREIRIVAAKHVHQARGIASAATASAVASARRRYTRAAYVRSCRNARANSAGIQVARSASARSQKNTRAQGPRAWPYSSRN